MPVAKRDVLAVQLLSSEQLAELLQIPVKTLAVWHEKGEGPPFFRLGRHNRYARCDVEAWLETRRGGD